MKSFFETLFIAAALAFVGWGTIAVGMKFEVKINGVAWGIIIGGKSDLERKIDNTIAYWNNSDRFLMLMLIDSMLAGEDIGTYVVAMYPMYTTVMNERVEQRIVTIGGHERSLYYFVLSGRRKLDKELIASVFNFTEPSGYTVTWQAPITKNKGFNQGYN